MKSFVYFTSLIAAVAVITSVGNPTEAAQCQDACMYGQCDGNICRCDPGYGGVNCDQCVPRPGCDQGYCNKPDECICKPGYTGDLCKDKSVDFKFCVNFNPCENNGTCFVPEDDDQEYYCICKPGYTGQTCSIKLELTTALPMLSGPEVSGGRDAPCKNRARCEQYGGHGGCLKCKCRKGFYGKFCQNQIAKKPMTCRADLCGIGKICLVTDNTFRCVCSAGYMNQKCKNDDDLCAEKNPCLNGGQCINSSPNSYKCLCKGDYTGSRCQYINGRIPAKVIEPPVRPVQQPQIQPSHTQRVVPVPEKAEISSSSHKISVVGGNVQYESVNTKIQISGKNIDIQGIQGANDLQLSTATSDKSQSSVLKSICFSLLGVAICLVVGVVVFLGFQKIKSFRRRRRSTAVRRAGDGEEYQLRETSRSATAAIKSTSTKVVIETERDVLVQRPSAVPGKATRETYIESKALLQHSPAHSSEQSCTQEKVKSLTPPLHCSHMDDGMDDVSPPPSSNGTRRHYLPDVTIV